MIFTSRFGALAARPVFPRVTVAGQEHDSTPEIRDEHDYRSEKSAA